MQVPRALCRHPSPPSACTGSWTFTWDVHSHPWQSPLAGNHGLASAAWAVTSLLLVLYLLWGFLFPGPAGELGCACMSLPCSLNPDKGWVVLPISSPYSTRRPSLVSAVMDAFSFRKAVVLVVCEKGQFPFWLRSGWCDTCVWWTGV